MIGTLRPGRNGCQGGNRWGETLSYRDHFERSDSARAYEQVEYGSTSHSDLLWQLEKEQLDAVVARLRRAHDRIDYLDFATGTGRVLGHLENSVDSAIGVEISESMAAIARTKVTSPVVCGDITTNTDLVSEGYDLITAFRFFLNAEPPLRTAAMAALAARLRDDTSLLVLNNHGNLWSHKLALWPIHALHNGREYRPEGNYMSHKQVVALLDGAGLEVVTRIGCGVTPGRLAPHVSREGLLRGEQRMAGTALARIGVNQMYVVRRRSRAATDW